MVVKPVLRNPSPGLSPMPRLSDGDSERGVSTATIAHFGGGVRASADVLAVTDSAPEASILAAGGRVGAGSCR